MTESQLAAGATVTFDVGGTHFKVAQSTVQQFPESMLAVVISDRWEDRSIDVNPLESKPLFIDRNPIRFGFVLDFLRDGEVHLPHTTTVEEMMLEMDYFNIKVRENAITFHPLPGFALLSDLVGKHGALQARLKVRESEIHSLNLLHSAEMVASKLLQQHYGEIVEDIRGKRTGLHYSFAKLGLEGTEVGGYDYKLFTEYLNAALKPFGISDPAVYVWEPFGRAAPATSVKFTIN